MWTLTPQVRGWMAEEIGTGRKQVDIESYGQYGKNIQILSNSGLDFLLHSLSSFPNETIYYHSTSLIAKELLMALIEAGIKAPSFTLSNQDEVTVKSADFTGRYILLWWYPKASTPG